MIAFSNPSNADAADHEQENDRELWINFGMYSLHGKEEVDLNDIEKKFNSIGDKSLVIG